MNTEYFDDDDLWSDDEQEDGFSAYLKECGITNSEYDAMDEHEQEALHFDYGYDMVFDNDDEW